MVPWESEYRMTNSIFSPIDDTLERADTTAEQVTDVLMVGGSSFNPLIREAVGKHFKNAHIRHFKGSSAVDGQTAVARGAALHALMLKVYEHGLIVPIAGADLAIETQSGPEILVGKGDVLPCPDSEGWAENLKLTTPDVDDIVNPTMDVSFTSGTVTGKSRTVFRGVWSLPFGTNPGTKVRLRYRMDSNQIFSAKLSMLSECEVGDEFPVRIENPNTNVVNPNSKREELLKLQEGIRTGQISDDRLANAVYEAAKLSDELGMHEQAFAYYKSALKKLGYKDAAILNSLAFNSQSRKDFDEAERLFRQAIDAEPSWDGSVFNLALMYRTKGRFEEALEEIKHGKSLNDHFAWKVLKAEVLQEIGREDEATSLLEHTRDTVVPSQNLSKWEVTWLNSAYRLLDDQDAIARMKDLLDHEDLEADGLPLQRLPKKGNGSVVSSKVGE